MPAWFEGADWILQNKQVPLCTLPRAFGEAKKCFFVGHALMKAAAASPSRYITFVNAGGAAVCTRHHIQVGLQHEKWFQKVAATTACV